MMGIALDIIKNFEKDQSAYSRELNAEIDRFIRNSELTPKELKSMRDKKL
jgi:hypothetical protein